MRNWLITLANATVEIDHNRTAWYYLTVYADNRDMAEAHGVNASCLMEGYWEVRDVQEI